VLMAAFLAWTVIDQDAGGVKVEALVLAVLAVALAAGAPTFVRRGREGVAFALSAGAIALLFTCLFVELFPLALPSTTSNAFDLSLAASSASHYTQTVMTVVAVILVPVVLAYQGWTYWVFRHRLGRDDFEGPLTPLAAIEHLGGGHSGDGKVTSAGPRSKPPTTA